MGKGSGTAGKRRRAVNGKTKAKQAATVSNLSQGADSETDDSELDFDPKLLLVQLNAQKTQKTKKNTRKLQRWSSDVIRRVSAAADSTVADCDEKSTEQIQQDKLLRKLERATNAIAEGKDAYASKSNHQAANLSKVIAKVKESLGGTATPQAQFNLALPRIKEQQAAATNSLMKTAKNVSAAMTQSRSAALDPRIKASMHAAIDKYF